MQPVDLEDYLQRLESQARRLPHHLAVLAHGHATFLRRLAGRRALLVGAGGVARLAGRALREAEAGEPVHASHAAFAPSVSAQRRHSSSTSGTAT